MRDYLSIGIDAAGVGKGWASMHALPRTPHGKHRPSKNRRDTRMEDRIEEAIAFASSSIRPSWAKRWVSTTANWRADIHVSCKGRENANAKASEDPNKSHREEYEYDPVSNRMVPKKSSSSNETNEDFPRKVPISTFKGYRSQFTDFHPPSLKTGGPPSEAYIDPDFPPKKEELAAYKPFKYNEPDGKLPEENHPPIDELKVYKPFRYNEPDGHGPEEQDPVLKSLEDYESRPKESSTKLPANDAETSYIGKVSHPESEEFLRTLKQSDEQLKRLSEDKKVIIDSHFPNDAHKYKAPYKYNEPDGQPPEKAEASALGNRDSDFPEDTHKYQGPYKYNEPDGHSPERNDTVVESLKEYDSKPKLTESELPIDDSETSYIGEFDPVNERLDDFLHILEEKGVDLDVLEQETASFENLRFSDFPEALKELDEMYKDYGFYTPDGQWVYSTNGASSAKVDSAAKEPSDLNAKEKGSSGDFPDDAHKYQSAYRYNEPDGQADFVISDGFKLSDFINRGFKEGSIGGAGLWHRIIPKSTAGSSDGIDSKPPFIDEPQPTPDELRLYDAYRYQEPDGHAPEKTDPLARVLEEKDHLSKSTLTKEVESESIPSRPEFEDLKSYEPFRYNEPDGKAPEKEDSMEKFLKQYDGRYNEPWLSGEDISPEKTAKLESALDRPQSRITAFDTANRDKAEDLDLLRTSDVRAASGITKSKKIAQESDAEKQRRREALEADFKTMSLYGAGVKKPAVKKLENKVGGGKKSMTGNFVRDFPEEFSTIWSKAGSTLVPADAQVKETENKIQQEENEYAAGLAKQDAYARSGSSSSRIQTSLDRSRINAATKIGNANADELHKLQAELDPYSKEPQGLETSYAREIAQQGEGDLSLFVSSYGCGSGSKAVNANSEWNSKEKDHVLAKEVREIYEDSYGAISPSHRQGDATSASTSAQPSPNLYKILAFEPSTQSVKVAETTSITPDTSNPLTPAEALMRLTNPAKFFPHFEPLSKEGYEIVSGSGDVLVFRKVRDAHHADVSKSSLKRNPRNPVDGMSPVKPATGNFASPTGFVNHDLPSDSSAASSAISETANVEDAESTPRFKSNIDVRREEPVFSGRRNWNWEDENEYEGWKDGARTGEGRKRMGTGKRVVVGAGMVGGAAYAVGVVTEWFRTGGVDGVGTGGRFN